jgi:spore coat protein CotH
VRPAAAVGPFDDTVVHQMALTMDPGDWDSIIADSRGDDWRHATFTYDGVVIEQVGVRPSGESSRFAGNQKMALRVKFDAFPGMGRFAGLAEINVKGEYDDTSMLRERLAEFFFGAMMPAPLVAQGRLVVNGQVRGLYTIRQVWDSESVQEHFKPPVGPLYRLRAWPGKDPYQFLGADAKAYVPLPWEPHINKTARGDDVVAAALQALAGGEATTAQAFDVDNQLTYLAVATLVMDTDGLVSASGEAADHFQYFDPQTGRFFILPWDPDNTFSSQGEKPDQSIYAHFDKNTLSKLVHDSADLRTRYRAKIRDAMAAMPPERLQAQIDVIYNQIKDVAYEDPFKLHTNATFDWSRGYVHDFITQRYAYVQTQAGP